jgi:hypothetical protein
MQSHTRLLSAFILSTALFFGTVVMAADLPKQGTDSFTNFWVATSATIQQGSRTFSTWEINGVARNDAGGRMFDLFGMRCIGLVEGLSDRGTCTYTDSDGDNIFAPFNGNGDGKGGEHGTYDVIGGTGKFAGITGSGEYLNPGRPIKADDKAPRGAVSNKISWKLP